MQIFLYQQMLYRGFSVILSTGLAKNRLTNWSFNCFLIEYQENWQYITIHIATVTWNYIDTHRFYAYRLPLKSNSLDFDTLKYVIGCGEYYGILLVKKVALSLSWLQKKLHVIWWIASSDELYSYYTVRLIIDSLKMIKNTVTFTWSSSFAQPGAYITHNAIWSLNDITGSNVSDYMQLPLEPQKSLYNFFHIFSITPQDL